MYSSDVREKQSPYAIGRIKLVLVHVFIIMKYYISLTGAEER